MMPQNPVTIIAEIHPGQVEQVRSTLENISADVDNNDLLPFGNYRDILHFARILIVDETEVPERFPASLVLMANVDVPPTEFLRNLLNQTARGIDTVFGSCKGYPSEGNRNHDTRLNFLETRMAPAQAYYINTIGRSAKQIRQEAILRQAIESYLDRQDSSNGSEATELYRSIREYVHNDPALSWAKEPRAPLPLAWRIKEKMRFAGLTVALLALAIILLPLLIVWVLVIRLKEKRDVSNGARPKLERLNRLRLREDRGVQNQFSAMGSIKPGWVRLATVKVVLFVAQITLRHIFNKGNLAGVKALGLDGVDTIHFARWIIIDKGKRMIFASNYDFSLESYMVDFVDKVAWGLNLVFSNGRDFPDTRWLVKEGARDEQKFKDFIGNHQIVTDVWYAPYAYLSAVNIANNEAIRDGLYNNMNEAEAKEWLRRL